GLLGAAGDGYIVQEPLVTAVGASAKHKVVERYDRRWCWKYGHWYAGRRVLAAKRIGYPHRVQSGLRYDVADRCYTRLRQAIFFPLVRIAGTWISVEHYRAAIAEGKRAVVGNERGRPLNDREHYSVGYLLATIGIRNPQRIA